MTATNRIRKRLFGTVPEVGILAHGRRRDGMVQVFRSLEASPWEVIGGLVRSFVYFEGEKKTANANNRRLKRKLEAIQKKDA